MFNHIRESILEKGLIVVSEDSTRPEGTEKVHL